jgi:uncharacterized iron-regulated membrane protein
MIYIDVLKFCACDIYASLSVSRRLVHRFDIHAWLECPACSVCLYSMLSGLTWHAAYGSSDTHMVTDEALAERRAALEGDPGTDNAVKVDMPQEASMHQAQPVEQPEQPLETRVSASCSCQKLHGSTALVMPAACLFSIVVTVADME